MNYMMKKENNVKGDIYMMLDDKQKSFVDLAVSEYGTQLKRSELIAVHKKHKVPFPYWLVNSDQFKLGKVFIRCLLRVLLFKRLVMKLPTLL